MTQRGSSMGGPFGRWVETVGDSGLKHITGGETDSTLDVATIVLPKRPDQQSVAERGAFLHLSSVEALGLAQIQGDDDGHQNDHDAREHLHPG